MALEYHEPPEQLKAETREIHRGLASLIEELEAIDWYQHRIDVTGDDEMRAILAHNRNEEMEHAAMALEWLRRKMPELDRWVRVYLFTDGAIVESGESDGAEGDDEPAKRTNPVLGSLGVGNAHRFGT